MIDEKERRKALAKRIKDGREMLDLSIDQFAYMIRVSRSTLYRYENATCIPDALTMELIDGILSNLEYQTDAYVPAEKVQKLLQNLYITSDALKLIKSMLFSAVLEHRSAVVYEGMLNKKELQFLAYFGYRIEKKGAVYIIHC